MNIWIVNQYAITPNQAGPVRHYALAREWIRSGHHVTIFASSFDHVTRTELRVTQQKRWELELVDGVHFLWIKTPPYRGNTLARIWNMVSFGYHVGWGSVGKLLCKPDIIIGSSPTLFGALGAQRLANKYNVPFVFEVRDLWPQSLVELGRSRFRFTERIASQAGLVWMLARIEAYLYKRATRTVTLLPNAAAYMEAKGADKARIMWIPNGVTLDSVPRLQAPHNRTHFTVMYAGTHGLANNLDLVLEAAEILKQQGWEGHLVIRLIGDGPEKCRLQEKAERTGIGKIVSFEPPLPAVAIQRVLEEADVLLLLARDISLYRWGISPNKLFAYFAAARPVILAARLSDDPVAAAEAGITVAPADPRALAGAVKRLAQMPLAERHAMGLRGRRWVEMNHNMTTLAKQYEQGLEEITQMSTPLVNGMRQGNSFEP